MYLKQLILSDSPTNYLCFLFGKKMLVFAAVLVVVMYRYSRVNIGYFIDNLQQTYTLGEALNRYIVRPYQKDMYIFFCKFIKVNSCANK